MTYFLDFDRTLFDTDAFVAHLVKRPDAELFLSHESEEMLAAVLNRLCEEGKVSFAPDELKPFVYADVPEFLRMAGNEAIILTFGNPKLQKLKIENALAGIPRVSVLYTDIRKGEFMKDRIMAYGASPVCVDDRAVELESLALHCPSAKLFEMRRDGGKGDGRWPVIHTLAELP